MGSHKFKCISRRTVIENLRFEICLDTLEAETGEKVDDFLIVKPKVLDQNKISGICILPEVGGRIGLMEGYRHQFDEFVWQAPAGFAEPDEEASVTACRELEEETGYICGHDAVISLGSFMPDAGLIEARVALFLARNCRLLPDGGGLHREPGMGNLKFFDKKELSELVESTQNIGSATAIAIYRYLALS